MLFCFLVLGLQLQSETMLDNTLVNIYDRVASQHAVGCSDPAAAKHALRK